MNYDDQRVSRLKERASPADDGDTELARLWFEYLHDQGVDLDDRTVRYWRSLDRPAGEGADGP